MRLRRWIRREKLPVIHRDNLAPLLAELGLHQAVVDGDLQCSFCGTTITLENLRGLYREGETVKLFCDNSQCIWAGLHRENPT